MLNRHVEVRQYAILSRDDIEQTVGNSGGVQVEHAKPWDRRFGNECLQKLGELDVIAQVASIMRKILRNEIQLSDIFLDLGTTGYTEKITGLKVSGDVRFTLPTSKLSQSSVVISRALLGLAVASTTRRIGVSGTGTAAARPRTHVADRRSR